MDTTTIQQLTHAGFLGYGTAAAGYFLLALLVAYWSNRVLSGLLLFAASTATSLWAGATAYDLSVGTDISALSHMLQIARSCLWLLLLLGLLHWLSPRERSSWAMAIIGLCAFTAGLTLLFGMGFGVESGDWRHLGVIIGHLLVAVIGMALIENLFRNSSMPRTWSIKYLCFGAGTLFAYDFFLYSDALLFHRLDFGLFMARGVTNLFAVPLFAVYAARNRNVGPEIAVSRRLAFYSATFVGAGLYLMTMAAAGYYVRQVGGTWSTFLQAVFFFGAVLLLVVPISSGQFRASLRVLVEKSFFKYQYDYREEWLRFIRAISAASGEDLGRRVIEAVGNIMGSPEGALWLQREAGSFSLAASWNTSRWELAERQAVIAADGPLANYLAETEWTVDLNEFADAAERYLGLKELPAWLAAVTRAWLIIPLIHHDRLFGIMILGRPRASRRLSWEDFDILKTIGRQAASYLALRESDRALTEARQFEDFNKRFAFVAHDIKNLVSQLSLILANAARHSGNAAFQSDMIETVRQSVDKMNRMLRQLNAQPAQPEPKAVDLGAVLSDIAARRGRQNGKLNLDLQAPLALVAAEEERLAAMIDHLVQNALDAVGERGQVALRLTDDDRMAAVEIEDNGPGMDAQFIRERLFRPFDTTKGSGYGIGVYESREYAKSLGGRLEVASEVGRGTIMRVYLPILETAETIARKRA
jgi:putative PEP-CTERM system histidine kinase